MRLKKRLLNLQKAISQNKLDGLFITSQPNIYYLSGIPPMTDTKELAALATKDELYIFARSTYLATAKKYAKVGTIWQITPQNKLSSHLQTLISKYNISTLGFEATDITVAALNKLKAQISSSFPQLSWKAIENLIEKQRQLKDSDEIDCIHQAVKLTDEAFTYIIDKIKPGRQEKEIALEIECYLKKHGQGIAFSPIVASGENSANPHYIPGEKKIGKGEMVLLDFGAKINGYCADLTRVVFVGKATKKFKKIYQTVLEAQEKTLAYLQRQANTFLALSVKSPATHRQDSQLFEIPTANIDKLARGYISRYGYPDIPHGVGHCLGLQIHELPRIAPKTKDALKPGMVFTIEPGIYLEGWGGVRIEDLVAWKPSGKISILSQSAKNLIEL